MMHYLFNDFNYDKRSKITASDQLFYHVLDKVFSYQVIPGEPFPETKALGTTLQLPADVIQATYDRLLEERYVIKQEESYMVFVSRYPDYLRLKTILDVETFFSFHGIQGMQTVLKDIKPAVIRQFDQWMLINNPHQKPRNLHRLHHTKHLNVYYSAISMNPDYLPLQCNQCDDLSFLLDHWRSDGPTSFTTMVMFSVSLPEFLAKEFRVLPNTSTFALRSSLLNQNGHMMATFMVVFSPRVFFNTKFEIDA